MTQVSIEQVRATYKQRDAWWTVLLVDPVAGRLLRVAGGASWLTPTRLTVTAFLLGIGAAGAFTQATAGWLLLGAVLYHASFVLDCMDGKLARLRGTGSVFGSWLDFMLDRVRVFVCTLALFGGQFLHTGDEVYLLAATGVAFLALFGYLNGAETDKARARMTGPRTAGGAQEGAPLNASAVRGAPSWGAPREPMPPAVSAVRNFLHRHRIRMNLVSGVEFEMAVFVVAPLVAAALGPAAVLWVVGVAAVLLLAFELALMARFGLAARSYDHRMARQALPVPRGVAGLESRSVDNPAGTPV